MIYLSFHLFQQNSLLLFPQKQSIENSPIYWRLETWGYSVSFSRWLPAWISLQGVGTTQVFPPSALLGSPLVTLLCWEPPDFHCLSHQIPAPVWVWRAGLWPGVPWFSWEHSSGQAPLHCPGAGEMRPISFWLESTWRISCERLLRLYRKPSSLQSQ